MTSSFLFLGKSLKYYRELTALIQTDLRHKCIVLHTFTIGGISINSHENGTVRSCWCRVKRLHNLSACTWKDFEAEIQGLMKDVHKDYFEDINAVQCWPAFVHESNFGYASEMIIRVGEDLGKQLMRFSQLYKITDRTKVIL